MNDQNKTKSQLIAEIKELRKKIINYTAQPIQTESENRLSAIAHAATDAIVMIDDKGDISYWNSAAVRMFGYSVTDALGKNMHLLLAPPNYHSSFLKGFTHFMKSGKGHAVGKIIEFNAVRKDKTTFPVEISTSSVKINGKWHAAGIIRDISQRKQTEEYLRNSEEKYRDLIEKARIAILIDNIDGGFSYFNNYFCELYGYNEEEMKMQSIRTLVHPDDVERVMTYHKSRVHGKKNIPAHYQFKGLRKNGQVIFLETDVVPIIRENKITGTRSYIWDITEKMKAKMALEESERRLSLALESAHLGLWDQNYQTGRIWRSKEWADMLDYSMDDIDDTIQFWKSLIHPEDMPAVEKANREHETGKTSTFRIEHRMKAKNGEWRWILNWGKIIERDEKGKPLRAIGTHLDITDQKKASEALQKGKKEYESLYRMVRLMCDNVPDLIWAKDLKKRYTFANKAICNKLLNAKNTDEPLGKNDMFFASRERESHRENPDYHTFGEICRDSDTIVLKNKKPQRFDEYGNVKGEFLFLDVYKAPFLDEAGNLIGTVGCGRDVTFEKELDKKRIEAEKALKTSEKRYKMLFEHSLDGVCLVTVTAPHESGRVIEVNNRYCEMLGYTRKEFMTLRSRDTIPDESCETAQYIKKKLMEKKHGLFEIVLKKKDGQRIPVEMHVQLIDYQGKPATFSIIRDISQRKNTEKQLLNTIHEKDILMKEIHHRVKNNLQLVSSLLDLQAYSVENPHDFEMFRNTQHRVRAMALIHEKLYKKKDLSRLPVREYVQDLIASLRDMIEAGKCIIKIELHIDDFTLDMNDAIYFGLIINELFVNSVKHAFPQQEKGKITIHFSKEKECIRLQVKDNGIGFSKRPDLENPSTLGLQLVQLLTQQLDGKIQYNRIKGAEFTIWVDSKDRERNL